jgi:Dolichyl-phosphate-mannose-protein mannosyltransferase
MRSWLLWLASAWEVILILLVAGFLRFYQINTTEFDEDQAQLFRMAYDAVHHALLPTTSNAASIGISNPPGVIYLFMPLAALSANPLWGAMLVGVFTTATALLTYFFTHRYYGRFAGIVAALLYATAARPLTYARFIWQPNLMPPFVVLFMFALFWGVVERRKGWLFPALFLFGILYQMHPTTLLLAVPLLAAIVLAPGTLRWRDLAFACAALLVIFFPYLIWEAYTGFADIRTVLMLAKQHAHIDTQAIHLYRTFLIPFDTPPTDIRSLVRMLAPMLSWLSIAVPLLTLGGIATAGLLSLRSASGQSAKVDEAPGRPQGIAPTIREDTVLPAQGATGAGKRNMVGAGDPVRGTGNAPVLSSLRNWWADLRATPYRCGLILLLVWQIVPLLILSRHSVPLHSQYFFMFLPGPFILIGLFLAKVVEWLRGREQRRQWSLLRYAVYAIAGLVIVAQLVGSTAAVIDTSSGNFDDRGFQPYPYHNDLSSLQHALGEADRLAQQRHFNRVYITTDAATQTALRYLAEQMQTPTTLFDATNCLVLPNPAAGPAVLLVGPYDGLTNALLSQFASATLIDQPIRPAGAPFRLYIVTSTPTQPSSQNTFTGNLQLLGTQAQQMSFHNSPWLVTRWSLMHAEQPSFRTTYSYTLKALPNGNSAQSSQNKCTFTAIRAGDQLLVAFGLPKGSSASTSVTIEAQSFTTIPDNPVYGPFHLETDGDENIARMILQTTGGGDSITVPAS